MNPWKYAENSFLAVTTGSFKLMNILFADHNARIAQAVASTTTDADFNTINMRNGPVKTAWDTAYTGWLAARSLYKGKTQALETKLADLSGLRIKQWDIAIQGVFLEGTSEYTQLLPNGRGPFQQGAYDLRIAEVKALQTRLAPFTAANPTLATLSTTVGTYHTETKTLREQQQQQEGAVDSASTAARDRGESDVSKPRAADGKILRAAGEDRGLLGHELHPRRGQRPAGGGAAGSGRAAGAAGAVK